MADVIRIVGKTNSQEITLMKVSTTKNKMKPFLIDEFFVIEDSLNNNPICRVTETTHIPKDSAEYAASISSSTVVGDILAVYVAKAQIQGEIYFPVDVDSTIRAPQFDEVKPIFYTCDVSNGLPLGAIRGTEKLFVDIPSNWNNVVEFLREGKIEKQNRAPFVFDYRRMEQFPHIGLFGGSGSGKTFALKSMIEELCKKHIPMVILDPHYEMTFEKTADGIGKEFEFDFASNVETFYIGQNVGIDFSKIETAALVDILRFSGEMTPAMESAVYAVHSPGDTYSAFRSFLDSLIDVFQQVEGTKFKGGNPPPLYKQYSKQVAGLATLNAISWRINELDRRGVFKSDTIGIENAIMGQKTCVIRGPISVLNIVGSYIANTLYERRRAYVDGIAMKVDCPKFNPFILIMDEAHSFAPNDNSGKSPMNSILETISKEGRKYGIFEILATQRPKLLNHTIAAQLSTKFVFRTVDRSDIDTIKRETDLDENSLSRLPFMEAGACFISSAINGRCMSVKIKANITRAKSSISPFDELSTETKDFRAETLKAIKPLLPIEPIKYAKAQDAVEVALNTKMSIDDFQARLDQLVREGLLDCNDGILGKTYIEKS